MRTVFVLTVFALACLAVQGQNAAKFSEAELDDEDQDFAGLEPVSTVAKQQPVSSSAAAAAPRFKEETFAMVDRCEKVYWNSMDAQGAPASGFFPFTMAKVKGNEKILFAASVANEPKTLYRLDSAEKKWMTVTATGNAPAAALEGAAGASKDGKIAFFGGKQTENYVNTISVIELSSGGAQYLQTAVTGTAPAARMGASFTAMGAENAYFMFGGYTDAKDFDDTYLAIPTEEGAAAGTLSLTWRKMPEGTVRPNKRSGHSATRWSPKTGNEKFVVFGGCSMIGQACYNDVWVFTAGALQTWEKMETTGDAPSKRSGHVAFIENGKLYVYAGLKDGKKEGALKDLYVLDLATRKWSVPADGEYGSALRGKTFTGGNAVHQFDNHVIVQASDASIQTLRVNGVCAADCKKVDTAATTTPAGDCKCSAQFEGKYCAEKKTNPVAPAASCPSGCSGHGECVDSKCKCDATWGKDDCSVQVCPDNCNNHGACTNGTCVCDKLHHGSKCEFTFCPGKCNKNGECNKLLGRCDCKPGFGGPSCLKKNLCGKDCSGNGECITTKATASKFSTSKCKCFPGFEGKNCSADVRCGSTCSGHGKCANTKCACDEGFTGSDCSKKACPENCNNHGECDSLLGKCKCHPGFIGELCGTAVRCLNNCSKSGVCVLDTESANGLPDFDGICKCNKGFSGADCSEMQCPLGVANPFAKDEEECSGELHGRCNSKTGKCSCHPGFGGFACEFSCPAGRPTHAGKFSNASADTPLLGLGHGACSGHGLCVTTFDGKARCQCEAGLSGNACDVEARCEKDCYGNGKCFRGECVCSLGFTGALCETKSKCPELVTGEKCSGHGQCQYGKCFCDVGYRGDGCEDRILCRDDCNGHGRCHDAKCYCATGYTGSACETQKSCPNKCSGHGRCFLDNCLCEAGFSGKDCSVEDRKFSPACQSDCSGNGECRLGKCFCLPAFKGEDCSIPVDYECPGASTKAKCSGNGVCKYNKCFCMPGFTGDDCSQISKCPKDCSGNGICKNGMCYCRPPFRGFDCNSTDACPNGCSERGICMKGKCLCVEGFGSKDCSQVTGNVELCPNECSGHGSCALGKCFCDPAWGAKDCGTKKKVQCPSNCNQQGLCHADGKCYCNPGLGGRDCSTPMPCPTGCTLHGICKYGRCFCQPGYTGANCSTPISAEAKAASAMASTKYKTTKKCPNQCSHNGFCLEGKCLCQPGYDGVDCSRVVIGNEDCPNDCGGKENPKGICWLGKCFCFPGFSGADCMEDQKLPCTGGCSDRGQCHFGRCFCEIGYVGEACETEVKQCPNDCMGRGQCVRGRCVCEIGYRGLNCNITVGNSYKCPNNCHGNGACIMGQCQCNVGFIGADCSTAESEIEAKHLQKNAKVSDQDAALNAVHNPDHVQTTDVVMPDSDYVGVPKDLVASHNLSQPTFVKKAGIPSPQKVDGSEKKIDDVKLKKLTNKKGTAAKQQTMRMMFLEEDEDAKTEKLECSSNGVKKNGKCFCFPGFDGESCENSGECPGKCNGQGICSRGNCFCNPGYQGDDCATVAPSAKSNEPHVSQVCPDSCSYKGLCKAGKCWCKDGFTGSNCGTPVDMSASTAGESNNNMLASAPLVPMNVVVVIGIAAFVLGLVGAVYYRRKQEALREFDSPVRKPLFK